MISHDRPEGRFNLRAGAIIMRDGHVLIHKAHFDDFWSLPGGRIEWGEASSETIVREVAEELGVSGRLAGLGLIIENFFELNGQRCHEVAVYHRVEIDAGFPFSADEAVCHRCQDGGAVLEFKWVRASTDRLEAHRLMPQPLRMHLPNDSAQVQHVVCREGRV